MALLFDWFVFAPFGIYILLVAIFGQSSRKTPTGTVYTKSLWQRWRAIPNKLQTLEQTLNEPDTYPFGHPPEGQFRNRTFPDPHNGPYGSRTNPDCYYTELNLPAVSGTYIYEDVERHPNSLDIHKEYTQEEIRAEVSAARKYQEDIRPKDRWELINQGDEDE
jgi:hypothetical protein